MQTYTPFMPWAVAGRQQRTLFYLVHEKFNCPSLLR